MVTRTLVATVRAAPVSAELTEDVDVLRKELDGYYQEMQEFSDPGTIFLKLAAWTARAYEVRSRLIRSENRRVQTFRTRELDPFLECVDRQFKIYSRMVSLQKQEFDMQGQL